MIKELEINLATAKTINKTLLPALEILYCSRTRSDLYLSQVFKGGSLKADRSDPMRCLELFSVGLLLNIL